MGCGSSSGYLTYEIDPFVGTPANENDNPPSSIYQMKRRKSDSNLRGMMKDPVVGTVFRDFLAEEMKEHLFLCWIDVEQYNLITDEQDIAEKQRTAAHIFNAYFEQNGPAEVQLDTATRMQIREVLQLREGIVNQRDFKLLKQAFFLAHQKIFTQLKFEYMPRFLSHRKFLNLSHSKKYFEDQPEVDHAAASILTDINLDYTLEHPLGTYFFKQFLQSPEARDIMPKTGEQLLELIAEIEDYRNSESAAHRFKRAFVIFHRFHKLDPSVHAIKEKADAKPRLFREPAADIFNKALATVRSRLEEDYFYEFKESAWFAKLGTDVCQIFPVPPSVRIQQLKKFALERNYTMKADAVDDAIAALDLPQILGDCMGAYYFKTFAHKHFLEEYVDFWLRVHQLRTGIRNPTTNSIMMSRTLSMTHGSLARSSSGFLGWGDDVQSVETEGSEEEQECDDIEEVVQTELGIEMPDSYHGSVCVSIYRDFFSKKTTTPLEKVPVNLVDDLRKALVTPDGFAAASFQPIFNYVLKLLNDALFTLFLKDTNFKQFRERLKYKYQLRQRFFAVDND